MSEAWHEPGSDRITHSRENDRDSRSRVSCGERSRCTECVDRIHFQADQLRCELGEAVASSLSPSNLENDVASLDVAEVVKPTLDHLQQRLRGRTGLQDTETPNFACTLRVRS